LALSGEASPLDLDTPKRRL